MFSTISHIETHSFSKLVLDYLLHNKKIRPFINHFANIENFKKQIQEKKNHYINRSLLVETLKAQNTHLKLSLRSKKNIDLLNFDSTFTITTAHQICLFTGPLYVIYKIISAINLANQLNKKYTNSSFVPVFWMGTEDHDFKEVNHIHLFGKKIEWDIDESGAVGPMSLKGFNNVIADLKSVLGSDKRSKKLISIFKATYLKHKNLAEATRYLINELFGEDGLVIIDGNNKNLKKQFVPQMKKDILRSGFLKDIKDCSGKLSVDYHQQAFISDINFFKLSQNKREKIKIGTTEKEIESNPEHFSPNVLLRPLYQQVILPDVAYVGGGSELAYWMQLKTAFQHEDIPLPILILRNSVLLVSEKQCDRIYKLGFELKDIFLSKDQLNRKYLMSHSDFNISLDNEKKDLCSLYKKILNKTNDVGLHTSIKAQLKKASSVIENLEERIIRSEKKKNQIALNQIAKIKSQLFPNNILQERYENFIPFYLQAGDNLMKILKNKLDPLNPNFVILTLKD